MTFDSLTVRTTGNAYFSYDEALSEDDCFLFENDPVPNIVSFSSSSNCADADATCAFVSGNYRIRLDDDYTAGTQIEIDDFNYKDYAIDTVTWQVSLYTGCTGTATAINLSITDAFTIDIADSAVSIDSQSGTVGDTGTTIIFTLTDITMPAEGQVSLFFPKQYGSTSMISTSSCDDFAFSGDFTTATCDEDNIDINSSGTDEVVIDFTMTEGTNSVTMTIGDFDNPFSLTAWDGFEISVNELGEDGNYYGVSTNADGSTFSMTALTTGYTWDASITLDDGIIEETDDFTLTFTESSGRILQDCDVTIVLPEELGFDEDAWTVQGKGCFASSSSTTGSYNNIAATYTWTYPDDGEYGGTITGEGLCPA